MSMYDKDGCMNCSNLGSDSTFAVNDPMLCMDCSHLQDNTAAINGLIAKQKYWKEFLGMDFSKLLPDKKERLGDF